MKNYLPVLLGILFLNAPPLHADQAASRTSEDKNCRTHAMKMDREAGYVRCTSPDGTCNPEMRGRCGKRRGDWYGASQPVANAAEARGLLTSYYTGQGYAVSEVTEKKWGFKASILDKDGAVIDRVMIDKRSGRIRSLY
jgi:hypothetical protein